MIAYASRSELLFYSESGDTAEHCQQQERGNREGSVCENCRERDTVGRKIINKTECMRQIYCH